MLRGADFVLPYPKHLQKHPRRRCRLVKRVCRGIDVKLTNKNLTSILTHTPVDVTQANKSAPESSGCSCENVTEVNQTTKQLNILYKYKAYKTQKQTLIDIDRHTGLKRHK